MKWTFARRYLVSRSSHSVINIIAAVSLVSVAVPVAAMVILLSVIVYKPIVTLLLKLERKTLIA